MKSVRFSHYGGPEVLRYEDAPDPQPAHDEVLVAVRAAGVNHIDLDTRAGTSRHPITFPHILGREIAGTIAGLPRRFRDFRVGDRVLLRSVVPCWQCDHCRARRENLCQQAKVLGVHCPGGYAEFVAGPARNLVRIPDDVTFEEAAAIPSAFGTAWHMAKTLARLRAGETVLIPSASGGVGSACVEVAKHLGARVIATASAPEKAQAITALGADAVINYTIANVADEARRLTEGQGVDVALELVGGDSFRSSLEALRPRGRMIVGGAHAGETVNLDLIALLRGEVRVIGARRHAMHELRKVLALIAAGQLRPVVRHVFALHDAAAAHRLMESRQHFGKIVLVP